MEHRFERANGIELHYVEQGSGPLVMLLHGFPDFWYSWRHQIPALAAAGYRVVAPDLRGYNLSERPAGVAAYRLEALAEDVAALAERIAPGEAPTVVGHDWGGVVAWHLGMHRPERIRALAVLNAPHPVAFRRELRKPSSQVLRSWYAGVFQLPGVPEAALTAWGNALLKRALRDGPARTDAELERYLEALTRPGALTAAIHYYRALVRHPPPRPRQIRLPTLLLWGLRDPFLVPELTEGLEGWVEPLEVVRVEAGHWLHNSQAERVNRELLTFLQRTAS